MDSPGRPLFQAVRFPRGAWPRYGDGRARREVHLFQYGGEWLHLEVGLYQGLFEVMDHFLYPIAVAGRAFRKGAAVHVLRTDLRQLRYDQQGTGFACRFKSLLPIRRLATPISMGSSLLCPIISTKSSISGGAARAADCTSAVLECGWRLLRDGRPGKRLHRVRSAVSRTAGRAWLPNEAGFLSAATGGQVGKKSLRGLDSPAAAR